ncbi:MAG: glycosyltransferase [Saprospiraceae bacterium]|nr:glycosyltransferase [Saprospiraceae bacterium]
MKNAKPVISIVTPSFNMLSYLKLCCLSVQDQGLELEHIVMDGGSTDGTAEWLLSNEQLRGFSEKDKGMYNALNKAIDKTSADIVGHLNCDEQYLPGTLKLIIDYFANNPDIDFIAGDFLVTDPSGNLIAYRKAFQPRWPYFFSNYLYTTTCTLFYRRKIFEKCKFDESYKSIADVIFLYNVIQLGFKGIHIKKYFSTFTFSGHNLSLDPISAHEKVKFNTMLPSWYRILKPAFFVLFFVEKLINMTYTEKSPLSYAIFTKGNMASRKIFTKTNPGFRLIFRKQ